MEISANGDAPGANQMVEGPVIDPVTEIDSVIVNLLETMFNLPLLSGDSLMESMDNFDVMILIRIFKQNYEYKTRATSQSDAPQIFLV